MTKNLILIVIAISAVSLTGCYKTIGVDPGEGLDDWTEASHSGDATPDYNLIFPENSVNRIDIVISPENWDIMQDDLDNLMAGTGGGGPGQPPAFPEDDPVYVPCSVHFNGKEWYYVGIRYKGNSSLSSPYDQSISKLPLRLDFDKFEDEHPEIWNQALYGFEELSLANNFNDPSCLRQKCADKLLRDFDIPTTRSAYYRVYVDYGDGPVYFGLYTMVEVVFDTFLESYFGDDSGNCYKPEGDGAKFEYGTFNTTHFEKKTNEEAADWSDIQALYNILHDDLRLTNTAAWRNSLESVFDVNLFLKWLAANTTIQNWDVYGNAPHNFYLYNDPSDGKIKWIPWDHNASFKSSGNGPSAPLSFEMTEVGSEWPLINFLINDPVYKSIYDQYIQDFIDGPFSVNTMSNQFQAQHNMIYDYAVGINGEQSGYTFIQNSGVFDTELTDLINHVSDRNDDADTYLGN